MQDNNHNREGADTPEPPDFPIRKAPAVPQPSGIPYDPAPPVETPQDDPMPGADRAGD
jgi:hypothetical protein